MAGLVVSADSLGKRRYVIQRYFIPLSDIQHPPIFQRTVGASVSYGLGADPGADLRAARYRSRNQRVFLNYFEVWRPQERGASFALEKAYLHLDVPFPSGTGDEEVLALHCEPILPNQSAYKYKRGPHVHVSGNKRDISKSHIALCLIDLERTCADLQQFNTAFSVMIRMVGDELLDRFA